MWFVIKAAEAVELLTMASVALFVVSYMFTAQVKTLLGYAGVEKYKELATKKLLWSNTWNMLKMVPVLFIAWIFISIVWAIFTF